MYVALKYVALIEMRVFSEAPDITISKLRGLRDLAYVD